jgi:hypothetical protein
MFQMVSKVDVCVMTAGRVMTVLNMSRIIAGQLVTDASGLMLVIV